MTHTFDASETATEAARDYGYDVASGAAKVLNRMPCTVAHLVGQEEWCAWRKGSLLRKVYFGPDVVVNGDVIEPGWSWTALVLDDEEPGWSWTSSSGNRGMPTAEQMAQEIDALLGPTERE